MFARSFRFRAPVALALTLGFALFGCEKGASNNPDGGGDPGTIAEPDSGQKLGGAEYVYAPSFRLSATTKITYELASGQGQGKASIEARSDIEATAAGDKLRVHGKVAELVNYAGEGQLDPEFMKKQAEESGAEPMDIVAELGKSEAWSIVDRKGETDDDATDALPENETDEGAPVNFGFFGLPDLPPVDLEVGKKVTLPTKADEEELPFGSVPVEVDVTWTLRGVTDGIAELDVMVESSGATEITGGGGSVMVSVLGESAYTVFFDTGSKLPVSFAGYNASEISIDLPQGTEQLSTNSEIETVFTPAG